MRGIALPSSGSDFNTRPPDRPPGWKNIIKKKVVKKPTRPQKNSVVRERR